MDLRQRQHCSHPLGSSGACWVGRSPFLTQVSSLVADSRLVLSSLLQRRRVRISFSFPLSNLNRADLVPPLPLSQRCLQHRPSSRSDHPPCSVRPVSSFISPSFSPQLTRSPPIFFLRLPPAAQPPSKSPFPSAPAPPSLPRTATPPPSGSPWPSCSSRVCSCSSSLRTPWRG